MTLSVALILLQLFGNTFVFAQNVCSTLPDVPQAHLLTDSQKQEYQKGDTIGFSCEKGYISGRSIRYLCTDQGWMPTTEATCKRKPCVLPDEIPNGYYEITNGEDFVFETTIKYFCNDGYQMISKEVTRTCLINQWSNHLPVCEPFRCQAPLADQGLTVQGLPDDDSPILPDRFLTFSCETPGTILNGSSTLICGKDGKWDKPFPTCMEPCTLDPTVMDPQNIEFKVKRFDKLYAPHNSGINFVCKPGTTHDGRVAMRQYCSDGQMLLPTCH